MLKVFKYCFSDLLRSKWIIFYFLFFLAASFSLLNFSPDFSKGIISLMNVILWIIPLISTILGAMYYYNSRDFIELLLSQPIKRSSVFVGIYFGLSVSLVVGYLVGIGIPFVLYGIFVSGEVFDFLLIIFAGMMLTFIFVALSFWISLIFEDKIKGFGMAIFVWLYMAIIYDGLFLYSIMLLSEYPLENYTLALSIANPIDLARIMILLKLDAAALMGFTGAVFTKFFGTSHGIIIAILSLVFWVVFPLILYIRRAGRKDF